MSPMNRFTRAIRWLMEELGLKTMGSAGKDVYIIILSRYLRLVAYGAVALILALYFEELGFSDERIGIFMTLTLLGDVFVSLLLTLVADSLGRRKTLLLGAFMMATSGAVFATTSNYIALLMAAILGVISPSGNEIGPFRAVEESTLAHLVSESRRSDVFTWYVVLAVLGTSTGLLLGGHAVDHLNSLDGWSELDAYRMIFWVYTGVGFVKAVMALCLSERCEHTRKQEARTETPDESEPLLNGNGSPENPRARQPASRRPKWSNPISKISKPSRTILFKLCSLFVLDSIGSGMVPFSLINFYMERKFHLPKGKLGGIMSATWFVSTIGNIFASSLAKRIGLIQAMVATHLPSSIFLALLPAPSGLPLTICLLVGRAVLNSMDQAPRSAFLSHVVEPQERTAVMGVVNILKTLSQSGGPTVTGLLAGNDRFWVAFVVAGSMKAAYDLLLLALFAGRVHAQQAAPHDEVADDQDGRVENASSHAETGGGDVPDESEASQDDEPVKIPILSESEGSRTVGGSRTHRNTKDNSFLLFLYGTSSRNMAPNILNRRGKILYLDAYDSFSNNIVALVEQCVDVDVTKIYIDDPLLKNSNPSSRFDGSDRSEAFVDLLQSFDAVVAGPGPGWVTCPEDIGLMNELWKLEDADLLPVFGICLGFQSMCVAAGAGISEMPAAKHGIVSEILHKSRSIFRDVDKLLATQYHSLEVNIGHSIQTKKAVKYPAELWEPTTLCPDLEPLAWNFDSRENGAVLQAAKHMQKPFWGVQFHPESICTNSESTRIIQNWWTDAQQWIYERLLKNVSKTKVAGTNSMMLDLSRTNLTTQVFDTSSEEAICAPQELAALIAHGDGKTLPDLPPDIVHCSTTGSGRLTVADVCEVFDIARNEAIVLESGLQPDLLPMGVGTGRYSIIGLIIPGETLRLHYYAGTKIMQLRSGTDDVHLEFSVSDPWVWIKAVMQYLKPKETPAGPTFAPFWGGLMGYASYEAGLETIDVVPAEGNQDYPDICFAYVTRSVVFDHLLKKVYVQSIRGKDDKPWVDEALEKIYEAAGRKSQQTTPNQVIPDPFDKQATLNTYLDTCTREMAPRPVYCAKVSTCQTIIANGQSYELCLTTPNTIRAPTPAPCRASAAAANDLSWTLYQRLTSHNPAPFSAYMRLHSVHIVSSSPERYICWDRAQAAQCRPIKGTVAKKAGVEAADAYAILSSSKERAENLMIVDLVRHQLHGVYGSGNVLVKQLMEVEEYETLWQLVSVIYAVPKGGEMARTPDAWEEPAGYMAGIKKMEKVPYLGFDAFVQSLPPGSMTGAPKKRSCEILSRVEGGRRRGIYSGVLGYFDVGGAGDFSVVIRTAVKIDKATESKSEAEYDTWTISAGGAITIQSTPTAEYDEMLNKFLSTARAFVPSTPRTTPAISPSAL
ncbi:ADC synthase [Massariosphaeria phaeospora]|uniref:p-aminobenzoic acid synthase n=1 Tax=Massariosphaeria phaeospora TaxID=100035 RepID=A0A7C8IK77_9PLEO|nr:ADC synthase [Massariosphaeria phaeospora]